ARTLAPRPGPDPGSARPRRWREAFSAAAKAVARSARVGIVDADFAAPAPWTAWAGSGAPEVFRALGQPYRPVVDARAPAADPPARATPVPSGAGYPSLVSGVPGSPPYSGVPGSQPYSGAPVPTSGGPDLREPVP